jgi:hypothetical protein
MGWLATVGDLVASSGDHRYAVPSADVADGTALIGRAAGGPQVVRGAAGDSLQIWVVNLSQP